MFKNSLIKTLKKTINSLEDDLNEAKGKNRIYEHDMMILIDNASELRNKITDLELEKQTLYDNIEFLFNNLPNNVKELVRPESQN